LRSGFRELSVSESDTRKVVNFYHEKRNAGKKIPPALHRLGVSSFCCFFQDEKIELALFLEVTCRNLGLTPSSPEEIHPTGTRDGPSGILVQDETRKRDS
jgi:hypothetical protein